MSTLTDDCDCVTVSSSAQDEKSAATYLDLAANTHGAEKGYLVHRALERIQHPQPRVVEIGPGGGAAVRFLAAQLAHDHGRTVDLTLIEAPGVSSQFLEQSMVEFNRVGRCTLMHELYSYGGGYSSLHTMIRSLPTVLRPHGMFVYRDVFAVQTPSLHERAVQSYDSTHQGV